MAKVTIQKSNFTAGELSDELISRTDIPQYAAGAAELFNVLPVVEGGVKKRSGTVVLTKCPEEQPTFLHVFSSAGTAQRQYLIEFSDFRLRVLRSDTGTAVATFVTGWEYSDAPLLSFAQQGLMLWIASASAPIYWLRVSEDYTTWSLEVFPLDVAPFAEINPTPEIALTPSGKDAGTDITLTLDSAAWSAADVGKYVAINGGLVKITVYTSPTVVTGYVVTALTSTVKAIAKSWTLKESVWTAEQGYPSKITYFKQRLVAANTTKLPNHVWFSRIGDERNFEMTTNDADAFEVVPSVTNQNPIVHLISIKDGVVALSGQSEFLINSTDQPLTPTTVRISEQTAYGADGYVVPVKLGAEMVFAQRGRQRLRGMNYRYEVDGLVAEDLSVLAAHIARSHGGIRQITYQQEPDSVLWCLLGSGKVASVTINREQQVVAWALHDFSGFVKSIVTVPATAFDEDQVFLLVQRGAQATIERMDAVCQMDGVVFVPIMDDVGVVPDMAHLVMPNVAANHGYRVVQILDATPTTLQIEPDFVPDGFSIALGVPFVCRVRPLPPELADIPSTAMQYRAKIDRITLVLKDTLGIECNGDMVELQTHDDDVLQDIDQKLFTGRRDIELLGWTDLYTQNVVIEQKQPLPFRLLALIYVISANEK